MEIALQDVVDIAKSLAWSEPLPSLCSKMDGGSLCEALLNN